MKENIVFFDGEYDGSHIRHTINPKINFSDREVVETMTGAATHLQAHGIENNEIETVVPIINQIADLVVSDIQTQK